MLRGRSLFSGVNRGLGRVFVVGGAVLGPAVAFAQTAPTFDVSSVTAVIAAVAVAGATVGAAYLAMRIGIRAWKWITSAA